MIFSVVARDAARGPGSAVLDVCAEPGASLRTLRPHLVRLTGDLRWAAAPAWVGAVRLDDEHRAGQPPWLPGAVLAPEPAAPDAALAAATVGWHLATTGGPASGLVVALPERSTTPVSLPGGARLGVRRAGRRVRLVRLPAPARAPAGSPGPARRGPRSNGPARRGPSWSWLGIGRWRVGRSRVVAGTRLVLRGPVTSRRRPDLPAAAGAVAMLAGPALAAAVFRRPEMLLLGATGPVLWWASRRRPGPDHLRDHGRAHPSEGQDGPAAAGPGPAADVAAVRIAAAHGRLGHQQPASSDVPADPTGCLAVVGPRERAVGVATALALRLAAQGRRVAAPPGPGPWVWTRWLADGAGPVLIVHDGPPDAALARSRNALRPDDRLLIVASTTGDVPAWCGLTLPADEHTERVDEATAELVARELAGARGLPPASGSTDAYGDVPARIHLGVLPGIPAPDDEAVRRAWRDCPPGLLLRLGVGAGGTPVGLDLTAHGPHLLVAGTTGSGKSELLRTIVLGAALSQPPRRLGVLLVDFKGGTGLGQLRALPHVVGSCDDLDGVGAERTLVALSAELRRRERVLARLGARDLADLPADHPGTPARLLVVVDEYRAFLDEAPQAAATLGRLAAQGRALGVHLVLATQRPAGAVGADLRANVTARLSLRVADAADSMDVLGVPDAARVPSHRPGLALLTDGSGPVRAVQVARSAPSASVSPVVAAPGPRTRDGVVGWTPPPRSGIAAGRPGSSPDEASAWVEAARSAARGLPGPGVPWQDDLPPRVTCPDIPEQPPVGPDEAVLAVADLPDRQRREAVLWRPEGGRLLVLGAAGTGRTSALLVAALGALDRGIVVHAVGLPAWAGARLAEHPNASVLGTLTQEAVLVARLLTLLTAPAAGARALLVVDGVDAVLEALTPISRGGPAQTLLALLAGTVSGPALAVSVSAGSTAARLIASFPDQLVLAGADPALRALTGAPPSAAHDLGVPGRAVHLRHGVARRCQVLDPAAPTPPAPTTSGRVPALRGPSMPGSGPDGRDGDAPRPERGAARSVPRLRALPSVADAAPHPASGPVLGLRVPLGVGGDEAEPLDIDLRLPLLIAGPPESGRTHTLRVLAAAASRAGATVVRLGADLGTGADVSPETPAVQTVTPRRLVETLGLPTEPTERERGPLLVVVDDLDEVDDAHPELAAALLEALRPAADGTARPAVLASCSLATAASAFRGPIAALVRAGRVLVLDPTAPGAADLLGPPGEWFADPAQRPPGRGVLRLGRSRVGVQVYRGLG